MAKSKRKESGDIRDSLKQLISQIGYGGDGFLDQLLGRGAGSEFLTNWDSAREFVISNIELNPRFVEDGNQRELLLDVEQQAYEKYHKFFDGPVSQFFTLGIAQTEPEDIQEYYNYLLEYFPLFTGDQRFLNVFRQAVGASLAFNTSESDIKDLLPDRQQKTALIVGGLVLAYLIFRR